MPELQEELIEGMGADLDIVEKLEKIMDGNTFMVDKEFGNKQHLSISFFANENWGMSNTDPLAKFPSGFVAGFQYGYSFARIYGKPDKKR